MEENLPPQATGFPPFVVNLNTNVKVFVAKLNHFDQSKLLFQNVRHSGAKKNIAQISRMHNTHLNGPN